ncbi:MAG: DUF4190 domain-containing protein [Aquihabitans sp.]
MVRGFGRAEVLVAVIISVVLGAVLSLLQLNSRRRAGSVLTAGALCGLLAVAPIAAYEWFVVRQPFGITNWWSALYSIAFYVWPAASSGLVATVAYRTTEQQQTHVAPGARPLAMAWIPVTPAPDGPATAVHSGVGNPQALPVYAQGPTNGLAIAGFVLSLVPLCGIGSVLAVVFSSIALRQIKESNGWQRGRGLAIAGLVLGITGLVFIALYVVLAIVATSSTSGY